MKKEKKKRKTRKKPLFFCKIAVFFIYNVFLQEYAFICLKFALQTFYKTGKCNKNSAWNSVKVFIHKFALRTSLIIGENMTNEKAIKALRQIKTYCAATMLDELDYVLQVMEKLEKSGIKNPLETDFTKLQEK